VIADLRAQFIQGEEMGLPLSLPASLSSHKLMDTVPQLDIWTKNTPQHFPTHKIGTGYILHAFSEGINESENIKKSFKGAKCRGQEGG